MKKIAVFIMALSTLFLCSCYRTSINPKILENAGIENSDLDRLIITNNRFAGKYTVIDKNSIENIRKYIVKATDATEDSKLDPDFTFDLYKGTKKVASFQYIAGIKDDNVANLIDTKGRLFHIDSDVEEYFVKRLMKSSDRQNVPKYYVTLMKKILEKTDTDKKEVVVVDIRKDYSITKSLTSMEMMEILKSIDFKNVEVKLPGEVETYDYYVLINTERYTDDACKTIVTVTDSQNKQVRYSVEGKYTNTWDYHLKYK